MMPKLLASYVLFPFVGRKNMPDADARTQNAQYFDVADDQSAARELLRVLSLSSLSFYRCALRLLGNRADAEDAVQEALLAAHKNLHQFRGQSQMSTWLTTIVCNCARMQLRKRPRQIHTPLDEQIGVLSVQRGVVHCHVGNPKTLARRKPIPLAPELLTILSEQRERTAYAADSDWVFASPYKRGAEPYWPDSALQDFVKPAVVRAGITKRVGWHTFRHSYSTLLRANGTDVKVQANCSGTRTSAPRSTCTRRQ
jgi:RNA polymerase sigma factor (sigma-70 family)